jgi:cold shock CspA family protein
MNHKSTIANHRAYIRAQHQREFDPDGDLGEAPRQQGLVGQVVEVDHAKRYGFLFAGRKKYFFHASGFVRPTEFDQLLAGTYVTFDPRASAKGPRAERLELA